MAVHRPIRYRLYPGDAMAGLFLAGMADACRCVWNYMRADCEWRYGRRKELHVPCAPGRRSRRPGQPGKRFTELRHDPAHAWLKDHPCAVVRYSLKYLADAYTRFLANPVNKGRPSFKVRHVTVPGFTISDDVQIRDGRLRGPKVGRLRLEGTERHPKGYAYVCYAVPAAQTKPSAADDAPGLDRNVGLATDGDGVVYALPDTANLDANIQHQAAQACAPTAPGASAGNSTVCIGIGGANGSMPPINTAVGWRIRHTVVAENLNTKSMSGPPRVRWRRRRAGT